MLKNYKELLFEGYSDNQIKKLIVEKYIKKELII